MEKEYLFPQNWHEITLQKFIDFYKVIEPQKPRRAKRISELKAIIADIEEHGSQDALNYKEEYEDSCTELQELEEGLTEAEYIKEYLPYKAKYIEFFSEGLNAMQMHPESIETLFAQLQQIFNTPPEIAPASAFFIEFEGVLYNLPPAGMKSNSLAEFIASVQADEHFSQIAGNNFAALPQLLGVLARPEGEEYNAETAAKRAAEVFPRIPMFEAWKMSFFLPMLRNNLQQIFQICSETEAREMALK